jgi:hypothetical protein
VFAILHGAPRHSIMSLLLASAALSAAAIVPACSWNQPGRNPYRGTVQEAVSRYVGIPAPTRAALVEKMERRAADDNVVITRDAIVGKDSYAPEIAAMHFGRQTVCDRVTRERWPDTAREPAAVYCEDGYCLIVPRICGNVSRVSRAGAAAGGGHAIAAGAAPRGRSVPAPAPEVDIELTDAMARLVAQPVPQTPTVTPAAFIPFAGGYAGSPGRAGFAPAMQTAIAPLPARPTPLAPVPEPAEAAMMLAGLSVVIAAARRARPERS